MKDIRDMWREWVIVDLDSSTIIGTNIVLVPSKVLSEDDYSDSDIYDIAIEHGVTIMVDIPEQNG